jgi:hypothetical protein
MVSDVHQLDHSVREYAVVGRIINDILKKIINLISIVSNRFGIGEAYVRKKVPGSGSSRRRSVDLADR